MGKMNPTVTQKVDEVIEALSDQIIADIIRGGSSERLAEESRALAELISVRTAALQETFSPWNGRRGGGAPEPRHPIPVPCPPEKADAIWKRCEQDMNKTPRIDCTIRVGTADEVIIEQFKRETKPAGLMLALKKLAHQDKRGGAQEFKESPSDQD